MNEKEHKGRHWCDGSCATPSITIEHEENTTIDPIVGNKATELAMEVWSYIFALKNSAKKTLRDDNNKEV